MNVKELEKQLLTEGFRHTYVWRDEPNTVYPDHTHPVETAHIILEGELTLTAGGQSRTYKTGERCDVPALAVHSARMGPTGCRYLIGEKLYRHDLLCPAAPFTLSEGLSNSCRRATSSEKKHDATAAETALGTGGISCRDFLLVGRQLSICRCHHVS